MSADFLESLRRSIGAAHVLTAPFDIAPYCTDWRGRYTGQPLCVVKPGTAEDVAAVVQTCAAAGRTGQAKFSIHLFYSGRHASDVKAKTLPEPSIPLPTLPDNPFRMIILGNSQPMAASGTPGF